MRKIGIDKKGNVILKMAFKNEYGYWTDNNLILNDFVNEFNAIEIERKDKSEWLTTNVTMLVFLLFVIKY